MTVWGEDTIHCVVLRKGDQLYMNILENPEVKGWLTEFYELSPDGYIKHGILFPSVFLEDFRKGLLNAQSIQVDSTDVISQPLNDYSDTVRYYWVLPTDEVLERYVRRDSFVFWTGTRATLKGFPFEEEQ
ncbi:MAG: hypothetical protein NZM43_04485 [Saprospiraceae bacterium]|nr:hypothetical protein [Saprospiraceae bacterium]MDW8483566.1 hypothetical protein [Saprospiraceae bacterium]